MKSFHLCLLSLGVSFAAAGNSSYMINRLHTTGNGHGNSAYLKQIKNLMILQVGGWSGLLRLEKEGKAHPAWPLMTVNGKVSKEAGRARYLERTPDILEWQMWKLRSLSDHLAAAILIMPDLEARAGSYGACWNGKHVYDPGFSHPSKKFHKCLGGSVRRPAALFAESRHAAWKQGLQIAPFISINNYECGNSCAGDAFLNKLRSLTNTLDNFDDAVTLKNTQGQKVFLVESLVHLNGAQAAAVRQFLTSRTDILWIVNLSGFHPLPSDPNILTSPAAVNPQAQRDAAAVWGLRHRPHLVYRFGRTPSEAQSSRISVPDLLWELNAPPFYAPHRYPVVISQWNEYAEYLMFEPNTVDGAALYDYLKFLLTKQP